MSRRSIALIAAILFVLSWTFPVVAGLVRNPTSLPNWWGTVDLALAFAVAVGACAIPGLLMEMWTSKRSGLRIGSIGVRCTQHWSSAFWSCWQAIGSSGRIAQLVFCGVRGSSCTFSRGGLLPQAAQKLADSVWNKGRKTEHSFATCKSFSDSSSRHVSRLAVQCLTGIAFQS